MARTNRVRNYTTWNPTAPNPSGITGRRAVKYAGPGHTIVYYEDREMDIQFNETPDQYARKIRKVVREREANTNRWGEVWQFAGIPEHATPMSREELAEMRARARAKAKAKPAKRKTQAKGKGKRKVKAKKPAHYDF